MVTPVTDTSSTKAPWQSKTVVANAIVALAALYPPASDWISSHPQVFGVALTLLNIGLRFLTTGAISWSSML